jgi:hypothetical protein
VRCVFDTTTISLIDLDYWLPGEYQEMDVFRDKQKTGILIFGSYNHKKLDTAMSGCLSF